MYLYICSIFFAISVFRNHPSRLVASCTNLFFVGCSETFMSGVFQVHGDTVQNDHHEKAPPTLKKPFLLVFLLA